MGYPRSLLNAITCYGGELADIERVDFTQAMSMSQQTLASNTLLLPPAIVEARPRDKSLPMQEEPGDDITAFKNSDTQRSHHLEDEDDTLIENDIEFPTRGDEDHDGKHIPHSLTLNERYTARQYAPQPTNQRSANLNIHHILLADVPEEPLEEPLSSHLAEARFAGRPFLREAALISRKSNLM